MSGPGYGDTPAAQPDAPQGSATADAPRGASGPLRGPGCPEPWKDPDEKPFIQIDKVTKQFGDVYAVDGVSLDIYRGELFCLLGASGCGKTTLLRMLAGFEQPTDGRILIDGVDVSNTPPYDRPVNMMFQSYALFPHMTVEQNVAFGLKQERLPRAEIDKRVKDMLNLVQMGGYGKRKPNQLSGGQRQRVALARSLAKQPKVLLLDEPLGALDKKLREQTQFELVNIQESLGITFVVVTHDQEEAMTIATRIGVMTDGYLAQIGTPTEIYEYPANRFVADFIGSVNLFDARVAADPGDHMLLEADGLGTLRADHSGATAVGQSVTLAVRPEKILVSHQPPTEIGGDTDINVLTGRIDDIAYYGDFSVYHIEIGNGQRVKAASPNLVRMSERPFTWNDEICLSWRRSNGVVLPQ